MTPICFPYRRTESAFSFFGSNLIARLLRAVFVAVGGIEGPFLSFARLILEMVANERLYDGHQGARDHNKVAVEHANDLKKRVVARHNLARFNPGDMPLADPETTCQVSLAPAALFACLYQGPTHFGGKRLLSQRLDTFYCIVAHA